MRVTPWNCILSLQPLWTAREACAFGYPVNKPVSPSPPLNNYTLKFGFVLGEFTGLFPEHRELSQLCPHLGSSPTAVRPWAFSSRLPALGFPSTALSSLHSLGPALGFITTDIVSTHRQGWFYFSTPLDVFGCLEVRAYSQVLFWKSQYDFSGSRLAFWWKYAQSKRIPLFHQITPRLKFMSPDHFFFFFVALKPWVRLNLHPNLIFTF